ncbi:MAG: epoxyqueuosine reductase [Candidatus Heimdallarchaeota archaeon]|nr:epoxyqueuosine reductase [Candidatus Heimdallarchaeota archaeon]
MTSKLSLLAKIKKFGFNRIAIPKSVKIFGMEDALSSQEGYLTYSKKSPVRFDIPIEIGRREGVDAPIIPKLLPRMMSCMKNMKQAIIDLDDNIKDSKRQIEKDELVELETYIRSLDISGIGYTTVPQDFIFANKAVAYENAIVLTMNMDNKKVSIAPSKQTAETIWHTYDNLGIAANKIARYLRKKGFNAHASHPLGGIVLYPRLAEKAGLGGFGKSGILITPINGGTLRLAAVYTNIENLPINEGNEHGWIMEYCKTCLRCVKECPPGAIYEKPIEHETGRVTHIDNEKCFPYFGNNYGCTVCIKVCPFNYTDYHAIKEGFMKRSK